jgi:hypothetical protein
MSQTSNNSLLITPAGPFNCGLNYGTNEFAIIGDELVVASDTVVPDWFVTIIGGVVNNNVQNLYNTMIDYNSNLLRALEQIEVAKNTYAQYISKVITDDSAYIAALTTLNSNIQGNDATIKQLLQTYATKDYSVTSAAQLLTASLNGGTIGAKIGGAESAMATQYGAMAQRLDQLDSAFHDINSEVNSTASAVQKLTTYTGLGTSNGLPAVIANSSFYRTLNAYLDGTKYGDVGGTSTLLQDVNTISTDKAATVEAKFEYGSTIHLGDKTYKSGFGLHQTGVMSSDGTTYNSEFWINASTFKVTNDVTGATPFSIDSNGTIRLTGAVKIGGALDAPTYTSSDSAPTGTPVDGSVQIQKRAGYTDITWVRINGAWVKSSGSDARGVSISASNQIFTIGSNTTTITPSSITLTANTVNFDSPVYSWSKGDTTVAGATSATLSVLSSDITSVDSISYAVMVKESAATSVTATDTFTVHKLKAGDNAVTAILTNENHTFTATSTGSITVGDYTGSIELYVGATKVTTGVAYAVSGTPVGCTVTIDSSTGMISVTGMSANSGTATITATYNSTVYSKVLSLSKAVAGDAGSNAKYVVVSGEQAFKFLSGNTTPTATSITITATLFGGLTGYLWQAYNGYNWVDFKNYYTEVSTNTPTVDNTSTLTLYYDNKAWSSTSLRIRCVSGDATDEITIVKLTDGVNGKNAIVGYLTNESVTVPATSGGTVSSFTVANGDFKVFNGTTDVTSLCTFYSSGASTGLTVSIGANTGSYTVSSMSTDTGYVTFDALYGGVSPSVTISKVFTIAKATAGATGARGALRTESYDIAGTVTYGSSVISYRKTAVGGTWTTYTPNNTLVTVDTFIATVLPKSPYVIGDTIPYATYDSTSATVPTDSKEIICTGSGTTGTWQYNNKLVVNGDAIISGTLSVDKLKSGYLGNNNYYVALGGSSQANQQGAVIGMGPYSAVGVVGQSNTGTGVHGSSISGGTGVYGYSPSSTGVYGTGSYGVVGVGTTTGGHFTSGVLNVYTAYYAQSKAIYAAAGDIYTTGKYLPFTGSHEALTNNIDNWEIGDIVEDTGETTHIDISNAISRVQLATEKSNAVVGIYANEDLTGSLLLTEYLEKENKVIVKTEYVSVVGDKKFIHMNALGEGLVNVCGLNGNISVGDLIVASRLPGKGMKQEDGLVRNCTVAKSRESVVFDYPEQVKMIACIYMCG